MGEAKRRRLADPHFGRIPERTRHRGLVVSPPLEISGSRLFARSTSLDPQELRFALLFWDRLAWPSSRAVHFGSNAEEQFLEQAGILFRPDYTFMGDAAQGLAHGQIQAFRDLEHREPGSWALAQGQNSLLLEGGLLEDGNGLQLALHRAIPVPASHVPLAEILAFKARRRDELLILRHELDRLAEMAADAGDNAAELDKCTKAVEQACTDLLKVSSDWQFPVYLSDVKMSFAINESKFTKAGGTFLTALTFGLDRVTAALAALAVGTLSTLDIKADWGLRSPRRPQSPYRYVSQVHKELGPLRR